MVAGVSISTPPAGRRGSTADVLEDVFVLVEASLSVFEAPDVAFVSDEPLEFAAPVLLAGADVMVEPLPVAEAFAEDCDASAVAVDLAVSEAEAGKGLISRSQEELIVVSTHHSLYPHASQLCLQNCPMMVAKATLQSRRENERMRGEGSEC